jgi:hypothetical protein
MTCVRVGNWRQVKPKLLQTVSRKDWEVPWSSPPSPAQADPMPHNQPMVTAPAKREIAEDLLRMACFPCLSQPIVANAISLLISLYLKSTNCNG